MRIFIAALLLTGAAPCAAQAADPVLPEWMAGCWREEKNDRWTEECWMQPRGGIMLGAARTGQGDTLRDWEALQIIVEPGADGNAATMAFWAAPRGSGRTLFTLHRDELPGLTFVNAANEFPQRIRYWREGDAMMAEIAMADGQRARQWRYLRQ